MNSVLAWIEVQKADPESGQPPAGRWFCPAIRRQSKILEDVQMADLVSGKDESSQGNAILSRSCDSSLQRWPATAHVAGISRQSRRERRRLI